MITVLTLLAAACIGAVLYSYAVYPLLLVCVGGLLQLGRDLRFSLGKCERRTTAAELPEIEVLISAYNEERCISERIENLIALTYPRERLRFLIGSDGSSDATARIMADIAAAHGDPRLTCLAFPDNRGKANVLNDLATRAKSPILVFSDANTLFEPDALQALVRHFERPEVGCVSGELRLSGSAGDNQDGLYWRVEQLLKFFESRIGGLLGANGAIYAIRRELWRPLAADTICDDFCIGMNVAAAGSRLVYEPAALAREEIPARIAEEYKRRIRIGIGNFQALWRHPEYLLHTGVATAFSYVSHKVLRWIAPHLLIIGLVASLLLAARSKFWLLFAALQLTGYIVAALCWWRSRAGGSLPRPLRVLAFLFALNWAFLVASLRFAGGRFGATWASTPR